MSIDFVVSNRAESEVCATNSYEFLRSSDTWTDTHTLWQKPISDSEENIHTVALRHFAVNWGMS